MSVEFAKKLFGGRFVTIACALVLLPFAAYTQNSGRQFLQGHVQPAVSRLHLQPLGRLSATKQLNLAIGLPLRNQQALDTLLQQIYDPASPNYRHYLTPEQFTEQFGPTEEDYQAVIVFMESKGLTVTYRHPNRVVLDVSGSVADIENTFQVAIRVYQHPTEARTFYAPDVEPSVDLTVPILHISGLDNYSLPHPANLKIKPTGQMANATPNSGSGPWGAYMGNDFRAAYAPGVTLDGSGQTVGLVQFDGYYSNDIAAYESQAGLPSVTLTNVPIDGGVSTPGDGVDEVSLDIEMVISMAPGVSKIIVYEAPNPSPWEDIFCRMVNDNLAKQLSCSWGDSSPGTPNLTCELVFKQMAAQGQSFFQASGDGDAYTASGIPFPSESPNITQVGGTTLTTAGGLIIPVIGWSHTATLLTNGQVLVAGGTLDEINYLSGAELYDPATGKWANTNAMNTARGWHTATLLPNGKVLVAAGYNDTDYWLSSAELYDPASGTWTPTDLMNTTRSYHTATLLTNGQVLVVGGSDCCGYISSAELFDPATGTWTMTGAMNTARANHTATLLPNGKVLVTGGWGSGDVLLSSAELYDPASGTWMNAGAMTASRAWHTATLLTNGKVLVAGGGNNSADLYNPASGTWARTGLMHTIRSYHTATLLTNNGKVLVAGGYTGSNVLSSAELYDPASGTWTNTGEMTTPRLWHTATLLTNGQVLAVGGYTGIPLLSGAELYDPATGTWKPNGVSSVSWSSETAWNWGGGTGTGGGISTNYSIPSWQQGINMTNNHGSTTMRNVPDVALTADNVYVIYNNDQRNVFGGTSCAAPLWAGFTALINQQAVMAGRRTVGFINPAVYLIGKGINYTVDFHDITTGNNTWSSSPNLFYATNGYDLCTGWGTPAGQSLINDLSGGPIGILVITPTNGFTANGLAGGPFNVTTQNFSLTNSGGASLNWSLNNTSVWLNASPGSGTLTPGGPAATVTVSLNSTASNLVAGTYTANVWFTNLNSQVAQSRQFTLLVGALVQNNGFETGDFTGWTLSGDTRYSLVASNGYIHPHSGNYCAELGTFHDFVYLSQTLPTIAGRPYLLSFWLNSPDGLTVNEFFVTWNGQTNFDQVNLPAIGWTNIHFSVTATGTSSILQFGFRDDQTYLGLDDVSVTDPAPAHQTLTKTNGTLNLTWNAMPGLVYQVQYKTNLLQTNWINLGAVITATNFTVTATNLTGPDPRRFYRLQLLY